MSKYLITIIVIRSSNIKQNIHEYTALSVNLFPNPYLPYSYLYTIVPQRYGTNMIRYGSGTNSLKVLYKNDFRLLRLYINVQ